MRRAIASAAVLALSLAAFGTADAKACKDPKTGKFMKCAAAAPAKPVKCKDAKGKFAKCTAPGAKPV
jgi:hypothetical protein